MKHRSVYRLKLAVCMLLTATGGVKARESDVVALVLGGTSVIYSGIGWGDANSKEVNTCGEGYDRNELNFPGGTGHAERPSLYHSRRDEKGGCRVGSLVSG